MKETTESMALVEKITDGDTLIAYIVRAEKMPKQTEFVTPHEVKQQVGFIVYPKGGEVVRHTHIPLERHLVGTSEVLLVRKGLLEMDLYTETKKWMGTWVLREGDLVLLIAGGHGFRFLEDSVLLEIKQGPYTGLAEKETF